MPRTGVANALSFAAIDFETANHEPESACALGVAVVRAGQIIAVERYLIRPPTPEFRFTHIHGLTWEQVRDAPTFPQVWRQVTRRLAASQFLAAHNARFDRSVLAACCEHYRLHPPPEPFVCTVDVARRLWNLRPAKLPDVCRHLGIPLRHHDPGSDAEACARIVLAASEYGWRP